MNEIMKKENIEIENMIFEVRGKQVMLDSDVAMLFGYKTKDLNRTVKNNITRFPVSYCFRLTEEEYNNLRCKNFTSSLTEKHGGRRYLPYVFTEYGITMLSGLLKSDIAVVMSIQIVDTFITMKKYVSNNFINLNNHSNMLIDHEERIKKLENTFSNFQTFSNELFFEGQIWDAHSLLLDIFSSSSKSIVIIDNYISKELLDVVCKTNKNITIYTKNIDKIMINKYQKQYNNLFIKINNSFHDRFIIIDEIILYHCGASFKDLGKKCFGINRIDNKEILNNLINKL
ncbi:MAG: ORF6N domain-containing protein [Bacilli bacterium]|nr:ORF6N domain-containing protein [Bacilli bacterium]